MRRTTGLTLAPALLSIIFVIPGLAAERTLVAEGSYAGHRSGGTEPYDSWKLWREADGTYMAEVVAGSGARITGQLVQTFKFDRQFLPSGYSLSLARVKEGDKISLSCRRDGGKLSCDTEFKGKTSSTSANVKGPCLVMVDDFTGLDIPWFFAASLRIFDANNRHGKVDGYVLKEKSLGQVLLEADDSDADQMVFTGEERVEVLGKPQTVRRFEFGTSLPAQTNEAGESEVWVVRVLANGLVASMSMKGLPGSGFELAEYKEYTKSVP